MLEIERKNIKSLSVETPLWQRLWTCRKTKLGNYDDDDNGGDDDDDNDDDDYDDNDDDDDDIQEYN